MENDPTTELNSRLKLYDYIPELRKLSAFSLIVNLWLKSLQDPSDLSENVFKLAVDNLLKELETRISDSTKHTITWYSIRILKMVSIWVSYHRWRVFTKELDLDLIKGMCLPELIWRPDGTINNAKSAEALLNSGMLNDEQEYRLVCLYCMEKHVFKLWHRLAIAQHIILETNFDDEVSTLSYWNTKMAGHFSISAMEKSIENRLLSNGAVNNLSSAMYFFDHLKGDERVEKGCELISAVKHVERAEYVRMLVSKFTTDELRRAFIFFASEIMFPLITNHAYVRYGIELWNHLTDTLTVQMLLNVMTRINTMIWNAYINPIRFFKSELDDYDTFKRHIFTTILDLWRIIPEELRKHTLVSAKRGVIHTMAEYYVRMIEQWDPNDLFLSTILLDADEKVRKQFMSKSGKFWRIYGQHVLCWD